ncbi:MAG: flagellar export chaperone FliS [Pirellulaceae bacterium]
MENSVQQYLEAQIMSATPQKLRLMLIEGAIRFARRAVERWDRHENELAMESLNRCRSIVSELLAGIRVDHTELTRKVAGIYMYLFRTITEGQLRHDRQKIRDVISVLEVERDTWQAVCEQMPMAPEQPAACGGVEMGTETLASATAMGGLSGSTFALDA